MRCGKRNKKAKMIPKRCVVLQCLECAWKVLFACTVALCLSRLKLSFTHGFNAERTSVSAARTCNGGPLRNVVPILHFCHAAERVMRHRRSCSKLASTRDHAHLDRAINESSYLFLPRCVMRRHTFGRITYVKHSSRVWFLKCGCISPAREACCSQRCARTCK